MIKLTQLEAQVLKSLINGLYAEAGFSDVDAKDIAEWINTPSRSTKYIRQINKKYTKNTWNYLENRVPRRIFTYNKNETQHEKQRII